DEHLDSDDDSVHEDYTISYDQYLATKESQDVPTEASSIPPPAAYMLQTLTDLTTQVEGHRKVNQEQALVNATLSTELDQCLGLSNPWFGRKAQLSQPTLYDGHRLLQPGHASVTVSDSHETLLATEFVPQKELSKEQVYWLSASDIASQSSDPPKPVTPFVHTRPVTSEVHTKVWKIKECLTPFEEVIKKCTAPPSDVLYHHKYNCIKKCFDEEVIPFFNNIKQLFQLLDHNIYMEVKEFEHIFDELDSEYEQTVLANKNLQIEKKILLIKNECLISDSISKDICFIVLASVNIVPPISNCMCAELRTSCDREHNRVLELEAEISKLHNMLKEYEK
nr:hypothetical protein [Tanacetum cinerariifolium]